MVVIVPVGAGGPVGIAAGVKLERPNTKVVIAQTSPYSAFIRSLKSGRIERNDDNPPPTEIIGDIPIVFEDGIAVDEPEPDALEMARKYVDGGRIVDDKESLKVAAPLIYRDLESDYGKKDIPVVVGGTTALTVQAFLDNWGDEGLEKVIQKADVVVLLGTEGNVDPIITEYIKGLANIDVVIQKWASGSKEDLLLKASDGAVFKFEHRIGEENGDQHMIDVFLNNQRIGYAHFAIIQDPIKQPIARMHQEFGIYHAYAIYVHVMVTSIEQGRYNGTGRTLLGLAERLAFQKGVREFYIDDVSLNNFDNFYGPLGYQDTGHNARHLLNKWVVKDLDENTFSKIGIQAVKANDTAMTATIVYDRRWFLRSLGVVSVLKPLIFLKSASAAENTNPFSIVADKTNALLEWSAKEITYL